MDSFGISLSKFAENSEERIFFKKLFDKLGKRFIRKTIQNEVKESRNVLDEAIQQYFQSFIIMNAVLQSQSNENELSSSQVIKAPGIKVSPLYLRLIKKYLPEKNDSADLKPLGLTQEDLAEVLDFEQKSITDNTDFVKCVEKNLDDLSVGLIKTIDVCNIVALPNRNWRETFDANFKILECQLELLDEERSQPSEQLLKEMQCTYCKEISEGLNLVDKLLSLHEKKLQFESEATQYYSLKCEALHSKIKLFELEILRATYTEETIPALKKISDQLDVQKKNLELELTEKTERVESYRWLGDKFESLVEEYTRLTKCITEQKWAFDELKRRTDKKIEKLKEKI